MAKGKGVDKRVAGLVVLVVGFLIFTAVGFDGLIGFGSRCQAY